MSYSAFMICTVQNMGNNGTSRTWYFPAPDSRVGWGGGRNLHSYSTAPYVYTLRMIHSGPLDDVNIESFRRVFPRKCADFS